MNVSQMKNEIESGNFDQRFAGLYGEEKVACSRERYICAIDEFEHIFGDRQISIFSSPGRSEISGNHTDHNNGKVIAASIDLDIIAVASKTDDGKIQLKSDDFPLEVVYIDDRENEKLFPYRSSAIIGGVADGFIKKGYKAGGFCAYTVSDIPKGSGLSSSAAFENCVGTILNKFYNDGKIDIVSISKISQYAENEFFGKPSGLMDQIACGFGGIISIDFEDVENPVITKPEFDLSEQGYGLCIINTASSHADLNEEYGALPREMKEVAAYFDKNVLRQVDEKAFYASIPELRKAVGDRPVLRAIHFFEENKRVDAELEALRHSDTDEFLKNIRLSGISSFCYLQNVYVSSAIAKTEQSMSLALAMCEKALSSTERACAWRVHGGGFAGTVQAFVPFEERDDFRETVEGVFGKGAVYMLRVRSAGAIEV